MLPRVGTPKRPLAGYSKPDTDSEPQEVSNAQIMLRTISEWGIVVKAVEDGYSEAYRDGIRLYRWKTLQELNEQMQMEPLNKPESGIPGIAWVKNGWNVGNYDPDSRKSVYLGRFAIDELELAKQVLDEAKRVPASEYPALREKYRKLRQEKTEIVTKAKFEALEALDLRARGGQNKSGSLATPDDANHLHTLFDEALLADKDYRESITSMQENKTRAQAAWQRFYNALDALGLSDVADTVYRE